MVARRDDPDTLAAFSTDESGLFQAVGLAAVYFPRTAEQVQELLREANAQGVSVTVSGAGTGITGGRVATGGGWELATEELRESGEHPGENITFEQYGRLFSLRLDRTRREAWVPAGIALDVLERMLPDSLFYPPDPTERTALLGATVATNASGARSFHYGATRQWVLGLTVVLPNGDLLQVERGEVQARDGEISFSGQSRQVHTLPLPRYHSPEMKNASALYCRPGMDLVDLFIGSEGLLGVVTEAHLKLAELPEALVGELAFFALEAEALAFADDLRAAAQAGTLTVPALEYFDAASLRFMAHPVLEGKAFGGAVFVELAGDLEQLDPLMVALEAHGMVEDWFADTPADLREQREFRHSLPEGINSYVRQRGSQKMGTDFVAPPERFRELLAASHAAARRFAVAFPRSGEHALMFGHLGDYHLHVNFLTESEAELALVRELYAELAQKAVALGGVISGEHGVGKKTVLVDGRRVPYLELMLGQEGLRDLARLKRTLDPGLVLNVGNMVPREVYGES
jgi:D-lactate dehydrogenase (cytochrome)